MEFEEDKYLVFRVGEGEFGLPFHQVVSIEPFQAVKILPNLPKFMVGLMNLRGVVTPIIDLRQAFEKNRQNQDKTRILVINADDRLIGFIVDDATDVLDIPGDSIQHINILRGAKLSYFRGVSIQNERLIILLDAVILLQSTTLLNSLKELDIAL